MSSQKQIIVRDLIEEAKKRVVFLVICVVGLSYLMSLTSSSVLVNLPASALLIIILRYLSLDYEMKRKAAIYNSKTNPSDVQSSKKQVELSKQVEKSDWRTKVNSPVVEGAIDQFTRHLISEWITDLWYSRLTPDKEGPEELVRTINGVIGEFSAHLRNVNIINLLTRDLINLICTHLELFRAAQAKIEKQHPSPLTMEERDIEFRLVLAAEDKLHPALFSPEAEHKVLQHIMDGLISLTFKPEDLKCSFFRYTARELLACAVIRPVLNLASPRFINGRIESVVINKTKANREDVTVQSASHSRADEVLPDHLIRDVDPSVNGVELVQLRKNHPSKMAKLPSEESKDPLLSVNPQSSRSWSSLATGSHTNGEQMIPKHSSGGEWGDILDLVSRRKTQALAPEHIQNMWTKGRNYIRKEGENQASEQSSQSSSTVKSLAIDHMKAVPKTIEKSTVPMLNLSKGSTFAANLIGHTEHNGSSHSSFSSFHDEEGNGLCLEVGESHSSTSYTSEDENNNVTGIGSPGTKVWNRRSNRNQVLPLIHHPLENFDGHILKKSSKGHPYQKLPRTQSGRKRSRLTDQNANLWHEVERTSFISGDGKDILNSAKGHMNSEDSSDDYENENLGRIYGGSTASSSTHCRTGADCDSLDFNSMQSALAMDSIFTLRCEVLGANIVKSNSKTFAVYSISVTDVNNNTWSIKRRFRHFEELHRRLKEYPEYDLHLPPKHFLSTGLDVPIIQERCKLLDKYLKRLMQLPTLSGSIEVWDFLSVDSQTYMFSNSFSIIETLSVDLDSQQSEKIIKASDSLGHTSDSVASARGNLTVTSGIGSHTTNDSVADGSKSNIKRMHTLPQKWHGKEYQKSFDNSGSDSSKVQSNTSPLRNSRETVTENCSLSKESDLLLDASLYPTLPTEWVPPNLSVPILNLIDVIFQLQDGGWIRRNAFWVAKQILQLGMGDALDDWLIEKIQLLRRGSIVASGIRRLEQILWPDGIFITKHPNRRPPPATTSQLSPRNSQYKEVYSSKVDDARQKEAIRQANSPKVDDAQQKEAIRQAKFVYELMIEKAPPAVVSLIGRKEYEQCAKELYFFLQSSVFLKQLAFDLLGLLLLSAFPELDYVFKQLHDEKQKFGELKTNS